MKKINNQEFIKKYLDDTHDIINRIPPATVDKIINILFTAWRRGKTVYVMGNGGSSSTASHFAADLIKYPILGKENQTNIKRFKVLCLTDNTALQSAWTNDFGFERIFIEQLKPWLKKNDVVCAFSVHGGSGISNNGKTLWSQNIPSAFKFAKENGARLIGFSGDTGGIINKLSNACIVIPTVNKQTITPQVEGLHVVLHHLIIHRLKELVDNYYTRINKS